MKIEKLHKLSKAFSDKGLFQSAFDGLIVTTHRQIDYANNVILVESDESVEDEVLAVFAIHNEATHALDWSSNIVNEFISTLEPSVFPVQSFLALYKTHFRGSKIFEQINTAQIDLVYSFSNPAYDDWCGEFFIKSGGKKYVLFWDYSD